jgi:hypothetical protein
MDCSSLRAAGVRSRHQTQGSSVPAEMRRRANSARDFEIGPIRHPRSGSR